MKMLQKVLLRGKQRADGFMFLECGVGGLKHEVVVGKAGYDEFVAAR